jgi:aspartate-semialdehyde dehydrogenase
MVMFDVAILGATGLVGETLTGILAERKFPVKELHLFASEASAGSKVKFQDREVTVAALNDADFAKCDVVFSALDENLSQKVLPKAVKHCLVIDKSSAFRLKEDVPLVVPEVNGAKIACHKNLIATPNCTTIPLVMVLAPLGCQFGLKRVVVASYQSASGAGRDALEQYRYENEFLALDQAPDKAGTSPFPRQLAGNVIPQIGSFGHDGYTGEERKLIDETRKILERPDLAVTVTCVRVPVAVGHGLAVVVELEKKATPKQVRAVLDDAPGLEVADGEDYPTPLDAAGRDEVLVGRIRKDTASETGINCWVVSDNLRKGAALNAVQIAELALKSQ